MDTVDELTFVLFCEYVYTGDYHLKIGSPRLVPDAAPQDYYPGNLVPEPEPVLDPELKPGPEPEPEPVPNVEDDWFPPATGKRKKKKKVSIWNNLESSTAPVEVFAPPLDELSEWDRGVVPPQRAKKRRPRPAYGTIRSCQLPQPRNRI